MSLLKVVLPPVTKQRRFAILTVLLCSAVCVEQNLSAMSFVCYVNESFSVRRWMLIERFVVKPYVSFVNVILLHLVTGNLILSITNVTHPKTNYIFY